MLCKCKPQVTCDKYYNLSIDVKKPKTVAASLGSGKDTEKYQKDKTEFDVSSERLSSSTNNVIFRFFAVSVCVNYMVLYLFSWIENPLKIYMWQAKTKFVVP